MIELKSVTKIYSTDELDTYALKNVDLTVANGEFLTICGPSGCGKSTLLSILGTHEKPDSGKYTLGGVDVFSLNDREIARLRREQIAFVFQEFNLIDDLSVRENVAIPLVARGGISKAEIHALVDTALDKLDILHRSNHMPNQLSGGQQQRVAIARAIVGSPKIIFADEPTGNLDTANGAIVMDFLQQHNRLGCTICMVTHNVEYAEKGSRLIELRDGEIVPGSHKVSQSSKR